MSISFTLFIFVYLPIFASARGDKDDLFVEGDMRQPSRRWWGATVLRVQSSLADTLWRVCVGGDLHSNDHTSNIGSLESSIAAAASGQLPDSTPKVFVCLVDGRLARLHLPYFLHSMKASNIDQHLVVFSLDKHAASICQQVRTGSSISIVSDFTPSGP